MVSGGKPRGTSLANHASQFAVHSNTVLEREIYQEFILILPQNNTARLTNHPNQNRSLNRYNNKCDFYIIYVYYKTNQVLTMELSGDEPHFIKLAINASRFGVRWSELLAAIYFK